MEFIYSNIKVVRNDFLKLFMGESIYNKLDELDEYSAGKLDSVNKEIDNYSNFYDLYININYALLSYLVTHGIPAYDQRKVSIPNKELFEYFKQLFFEKDNCLKYYYNLMQNSSKILEATLNKNTKALSKLLYKGYIKEEEKFENIRNILEFIIKYGYYDARATYDIEDKINIVERCSNFIFYP